MAYDAAPNPKRQRGAVGSGAIIFALLASVLLPIGYCSFRPDLYFNDVDRHILTVSKGLDSTVELVPAIFESGETRAAVEGRLGAIGYDFEPNRKKNPAYFAKDGPAGLSAIACSVTFVIAVGYDDNDRLQTATAQVQSACL